MGAKSARKGADGERELAAILRGHGYDIQRGGTLTGSAACLPCSAGAAGRAGR